MKDTEIVKNKDRREEAARGKKRRPPSHKSQSCIAILAQQRQPTDASDSPTDEHPTNHALSLERKPVSP
uniref:Uncharacterized protein n=1 Tax=Oryza rufipogon TaxID=4529 RepID=A0A0E0QKP7_ORYRU